MRLATLLVGARKDCDSFPTDKGGIVSAIYEVIPGLEGSKVRYRLAVLDANVAKELERFYRVGFAGMADDDAKNRVRAFLLTGGMADEVYAGTAALELAQPYGGRFDQHKHDTYVHAVNSVTSMTPDEWREVYTTGVPLSKLSPTTANILDTVGLTLSQLPEVLGDAAVLAKTWELLDQGLAWNRAASALAEFCDSTIRYVPGMAFTLGLTLVAGHGAFASEFLRVLKYSPHVGELKKSSRVFNAAFDLRFLATIASMPIIHRVATGENLSPSCGLTADKGTVVLSKMVERFSKPGIEASTGLGVRVWEPIFEGERYRTVLQIQNEVNAGQRLRRRSPSETDKDTRTTLFACATYLDAALGSSWLSEAEAVDESEDAWWRVREEGHPAWRLAQRMGWDDEV